MKTCLLQQLLLIQLYARCDSIQAAAESVDASGRPMYMYSHVHVFTCTCIGTCTPIWELQMANCAIATSAATTYLYVMYYTSTCITYNS